MWCIQPSLNKCLSFTSQNLIWYCYRAWSFIDFIMPSHFLFVYICNMALVSKGLIRTKMSLTRAISLLGTRRRITNRPAEHYHPTCRWHSRINSVLCVTWWCINCSDNINLYGCSCICSRMLCLQYWES